MTDASLPGRNVEPYTAPKSDGQWRRVLFGVCTLLLLCMLTAPFFFNSLDRGAPAPRGGQVSYRDWGALTRPVSLGGDWAFAWKTPKLSGASGGTAPMTMRVPGKWVGEKTPDGAILPQQGRALFQLTVHDLRPGRYELYLPSMYAGNRVFINEELVGARGVAGDDAASTVYFVRAHHIPFEAKGGDVRIAVDFAAFHHRDSGIDGVPVIGLAEPMQLWGAVRWGQEMLFQSSLMLLGLYALVVFLYRRKDRASLYFAISSFLFMGNSLVAGYDNMLMMAFPGLSFGAMMFVIYLSSEAALGFFLAYAHLLFPRESPRWAFRSLLTLIIGFMIIQAGSFAFGSVLIASNVNVWLFDILIIVFSYLMVVLVRAAIRGRDGAVVFLLGMGLFFLSIILIAIVAYGFVPRDRVPGIDFTTYGILILLFSHIIILAERWSLATRAAERMNDDLRQLLDVNLAITSEMQLEALLTRIVSVTTKIIHADRSSLLIHDASSHELRSIVAEGVTARELRFPADEGLAGHALRTGETVNVLDAYRDPRFTKSMDELTGYRTRSILTVPVTARDGRRIGVMQALNRSRPGPFDGDDVARMSAFAAQAAIAIDNATLFKEVVASRNYNESILRSMSNGVITVDQDGLITTFNAAACDLIGVTAEQVRGANLRNFIELKNPWVVPEIDAVNATGQPKTLLDIDVCNARDEMLSANVSIVPLMSEAEQVGLLILIDDISQGKRLEGAMRRFMTQKVVDQVLGRRDELLFGTACQASVLFADIRNFTSLAESLEPRATVDMLNEVFTELYEAVSDADGVLDKYIGDAVMAVYGAPLSSGRDAANAVASAIRMQEMIAAINQSRALRNLPDLRLGVGIASGEVVAGTIGSPKRMDYTVIGDSVNLAARLEDATKFYQSGIIICEATAAANSEIAMRELDLIRVRGRQRPARIYEVLTANGPKGWREAYQLGRDLLAIREWQPADAAFGTALTLLPTDRAAAIMQARARSAFASPPTPDWDGVWDAQGPTAA